MVGFGTLSAAMTGGRDIAADLQQKGLRNKLMQDEQRRAEVQRRAGERIAETVADLMRRNGQGGIVPAPRPQQRPQMGALPGQAAPVQVPPAQPLTAANTEGTTMPMGGMTAPLQAPQGAAPQSLPAGGAQAAPTPPGSAPQPGLPSAQPQAPKMPSTREVLEALSMRQDIPAEERYAAMEQLEKQRATEEQRESVNYQKQLDREARLYRDLETIKTRYSMAGNNELEKTKLAKEYDLKVQELRNIGSADVASIGANSRERVAALNAENRERINTAKINSQEGLASAKLEYQKAFDKDKLDLQADSKAKDFLLKSRQLDLEESGMNKKEAQFYAKLEQDKTLAEMRDATTQRGQDLILERAKMVQEAKLNVEEAKVAAAMPAVIDKFDMIEKTANELLAHPGMDNATGPLQAHLFSAQGDTRAFEELVETLKAQIGFGELQNMRTMSPTGGALGNVSNKEVEFLQKTVRSLALTQDAETFIKNLREIADNANRAKARTRQAYETRFGNKATGGPVPVASTTPKPGGETIDVPPELVGEPENTPIKNGKTGKTYIRRGDKLIETGQ